MCPRLPSLGVSFVTDVFNLFSGQFETVKWLHENGCPWDELTILESASKVGNVEMMRWLLEKTGLEITGQCHHKAAKCLCPPCLFLQLFSLLLDGHWNIITSFPLLLDLSDKNENAASGAACAGNGQMLKDLMAQEIVPLVCLLYSEKFSYFAGYGGNIKILEWIGRAGPAFMELSAMTGAAGAGQIEAMKWLMQKYPTVSERLDGVFLHAIEKGQIDVVKFLVEKKKIDTPRSVLTYAAQYGELDLLKFLVDENHIPLPSDIFVEVIRHGHANILEWLIIDKNFEIDESILGLWASTCGNLEIYKWLFANGIKCPILVAGSPECLDYLEENKLPWVLHGSATLAIENSDVELLKRLKSLRSETEWDDYLRDLVTLVVEVLCDTSPGVIEFLMGNGLRMDTPLLVQFINAENLPVLKWLHSAGHMKDPELAEIMARRTYVDLRAYADRFE